MMAVSGATRVWPATDTTMPSSTASVSGRLMVKVEPLPRPRADGDAAAQRLDGAPDHVHADAAPGDVRNWLGGREARQEDQIVDLLVGQGCVGRDQPFDADGDDAVAVDAAAVVGDSSMTMRPERCRAESMHDAFGRLAAAARRSSGVSRPWSMALRIMWVSGSPVARSPSCRLRFLALGDQADLLAGLRRDSRTRRGMR